MYENETSTLFDECPIQNVSKENEITKERANDDVDATLSLVQLTETSMVSSKRLSKAHIVSKERKRCHLKSIFRLH